MARSNRLSSIFSLGNPKDDAPSTLSPSSSSSKLYDVSQDNAIAWSAPQVPQSHFKNKLHKNTPSVASNLSYLDTMAESPLAPPPAIGADGIPRPQSSSGQLSRPSSRQASREGTSSRPTTPSLLVPSDSATSLSRPQTPTTLHSPRPQTPNAHKISKRRSWLPGKSDRVSPGPEPYPPEPQAWIAGLKEHVPYDLKPLLDGEKVSDAVLAVGRNSADIDMLGTRVME